MNYTTIPPGVTPSHIRRFQGQQSEETEDLLAVEAPLEIRVEYGPAAARQIKPLSVTMRTPGADEDLTSGFLFTEGIIRQAGDLIYLKTISENILLAALEPALDFEPERLNRHFYTSSSCGVCGKSSIAAVMQTGIKSGQHKDQTPLDPAIIYGLPDTLRRAQESFDVTGGLHAAALFDRQGVLLGLREDVGRHNALDKLIGHFFRREGLPAGDRILLLSGRASFELLQKAAMAGLRTVCAVGAPSSLAVETAEAFGITLVGFLRDQRFNLYSCV